MKFRILIISTLIFLQAASLKAWLVCKNFFDYYHFSLFDLELQLIYAINHDQGLNVFIARMFHNKLLQFFIDVYKRYTHFLDPQLLITLLSFAGLFGVLVGIWYFLKSGKRNKKILFLILISFLFPLLEVITNFKINFIFKLLLIAMPFMALSIYGHLEFIKSQNKFIYIPVYLILIILSLSWLILIPDQALKYCIP